MINTQYITLNMTPHGVLPVLHCSQYDVGRPLGVAVYNDSATVDLDDYICTVEATRSDGTAIIAAVTTADNVGVFTTTATMTNKADIYKAQLVLVDSNRERVASLPFVMHVVPAAMDENGVPVVEDLSLFQQYSSATNATLAALIPNVRNNTIGISNLSTQINQLAAAVGTPLTASTAASMTDTGKIYVYVGSESGYTYGDWYYYNGSAWVSGGVYNSTALETDKTLTLQDVAADAKATGDRLDLVTVLTTAYLADNDDALLVDNSGNYLSGSAWMALTDKTGTEQNVPADARMVGKTFLMGVNSMGLPVMYLTHPDIETLQSKADGDLSDVGIVFASKGIDTKLKKFKVQGASSQSYPEKNYTITFNSNVKLNDAWGYHKKYVIKADWVDFSHMRNEIGAKLWGAVRATRINPIRAECVNDEGDYLVDGSGNRLAGENSPAFAMGMNYGAVDGYPICVYINGQYWGIYSLMVPKDDWMAGMTGENTYEAIVSAENHSLPTQFKGLVEAPNEDGEMYDANHTRVAYSMEYVTDEDDMSWLSTSLNTLISAVMATYSTPEECLAAVGQYIDIDSAIDYMIFNCIINNIDGLDKNFLLDTWDGTKWYFAAYDMDGTFGNNWDGKSYIPATGGSTFAEYANTSKLMQILYDYAPEVIKERYNSLRSGVLSEANVSDMVWNYAVKIPDAAFNYEAVRWPSRPGTHTNNHEQILRYYQLRCTALDAEIATL